MLVVVVNHFIRSDIRMILHWMQVADETLAGAAQLSRTLCPVLVEGQTDAGQLEKKGGGHLSEDLARGLGLDVDG